MRADVADTIHINARVRENAEALTSALEDHMLKK